MSSFTIEYPTVPPYEAWPVPLWTPTDYEIVEEFLYGFGDEILTLTSYPETGSKPPALDTIDELYSFLPHIRKLRWFLGPDLPDSVDLIIEPSQEISLPNCLREGASTLPETGEWARIRVELIALLDRIEQESRSDIQLGFVPRVSPFSNQVSRYKSIQL